MKKLVILTAAVAFILSSCNTTPNGEAANAADSTAVATDTLTVACDTAKCDTAKCDTVK